MHRSILLLFLFVGLSASQSIEIPQTCPDGTFFDVSGLQCTPCNSNEEYVSGRCKCATGTFRYFSSPRTDGFDFGTCITCDEQDMVASVTGEYCVRCDNSTGTTTIASPSGSTAQVVEWQAATKQGSDCVCASPASNAIATEFIGEGVPMFDDGGYVKRCLVCPSGTYPASGLCKSCPYPKIITNTGACVCRDTLLNGTHCVEDNGDLQYAADKLQLSVQGAVQVSMKLASGRSVFVELSAPLLALLGLSARRCLDDGHRQSCNALANLCVLGLYSSGNFACDAYTSLLSQRRSRQYHTDTIAYASDWPHTLPWLMYGLGPTQWTEAEDVAIRVTFEGGSSESGVVSELSFLMAAYSLNGTWLGFRNVTDQLQLCGGTKPHSLTWRKFGVNFLNECEISAWDMYEAATGNSEEQVLFDMFLVDGENKLYPVPVLILEPDDSEAAKLDAWTTVLYRRFFLVDVATGVEEGTATPTAVQYAQEMKLTITLNGEGKIHAPLLTVRYTGASLSGSNANLKLPVSFEVKYQNNPSTTKKFWEFWQIILIAALVGAGLVWMAAMYQFMRTRRSDNLEGEVIIFAVVKMADIGSLGLMVVLLIVSILYWLVTFKFQQEVSILMIEDDELDHFATVTILALVGQFLGLLHMIFKQIQYDMFFIDWEKPRRVLSHQGAFEESAPISCWRMLFVANEWNELQTVRQTSPAFTMVCMVVVLEGLHLKLASMVNPDESDLSTNPYAQGSLLLRFGMDASLFIVIALAQVLYQALFVNLYIGHPLTQFIDLLFLSNISCIILDDKFSGYYLHGRNQTQFADTNLRALNNALLAEEQGLVANRGLTAGNNSGESQDLKENQTFTIFLPREIRERYERIMRLGRGAAAQRQRETQTASKTANKNPSREKDSTMCARDQISEEFRKLVVDVENNHAQQVVPASFLFRMLRIPPELSSHKPVFVHDHHMSFSTVMFYGHELRLLIFEMLLFCALDMALDNPPLVAGITYLASLIVQSVRGESGERNISNKTMVDKHFLI